MSRRVSIRCSSSLAGVCAKTSNLNAQCVDSFQCREEEGKK